MDTSLNKFYVLLIIFCFLPNLSSAQEVYDLHQLTSQDGLISQRYNDFVFQDSKGLVWIGCINGLNVYDGKEVRNYFPEPNDPFSLSSIYIQSDFFEDEHSNIWFSTNNAIQFFERKTNRFLNFIDSLPPRFRKEGSSNKIIHLDINRNELWFQFASNLYCINLLKKEQVWDLGKISITDKSLLTPPDENKECFLFIDESEKVGIYKISNGEVIERTKFKPSKGLKFSPSSFYFDQQNTLWIGSDIGLIKLNIPSKNLAGKLDFEIFDSYNDSQKIKDIVDVEFLKPSSLIISTRENGIFEFDPLDEKFKNIFFNENKTKTLKRIINRTYLDSNKNLWMSSVENGIFYTNLDDKKFKTFLPNAQSNILSSQNFKFLTFKEDSLWGITSNEIVGFDISNSAQIFEVTNRTQLADRPESLNSLYIDFEGNLVLSTRKGVLLRNKDENIFKKVIQSDNNPSNEFNSVFSSQLKNGTILSGTAGEGLFEIANNRLSKVKGIDPNSVCLKFFENRNGDVYIQQEEELILYKVNNNEFIKKRSWAFDGIITSFYEDPTSSNLWISSIIGLHSLDQKSDSSSLVKVTGLAIEEVNGLLVDDKGFFWMSSNTGILKYHPESKNFKFYTEQDGLQAGEYNFWSYCKLKDGRFAFGGVNGIDIFHPDSIGGSAKIHHPMITEFLINDLPPNPTFIEKLAVKNISERNNLNVDYSENTLSFRFSALDYSTQEFTKYRYKLLPQNKSLFFNHPEEQDIPWVQNGTFNFARFPALETGSYTFAVDASDSEGNFSDDPNRWTTLDIKVNPPFWQTWWFRTLILLLGLAIIYTIYKIRVNQIQKRAEFKRKEAEFKQKEAEYKQLVAETETAVLRLQMNPHFVFNSMNSINSYILNKDIDTANNYLTRFAKLMRMILNLGKKPLISVGEEIELLELYLQTEAMRFEQKFDYQFDFSEDFDPDEYLLPTMILQPFAENAIWHGLSNKKGKGKITIQFLEKDNALICKLRDNGVGRAGSKKRKNSKNPHESKALAITKKRLEVLAEKEGQPAFYKFIDLKDESNQACGTEVHIQIPIL